MIENHPHIILTENNKDLVKLEEPIEQHILSDPIEYVHKVSLIKDNIEETITEAYKETYDKICMVCDDTRPCSPHVDEGLESLLPCNIFEARSSEEDCYEYKEDMDK